MRPAGEISEERLMAEIATKGEVPLPDAKTHLRKGA
jgi:hypothetical protein